MSSSSSSARPRVTPRAARRRRIRPRARACAAGSLDLRVGDTELLRRFGGHLGYRWVPLGAPLSAAAPVPHPRRFPPTRP